MAPCLYVLSSWFAQQPTAARIVGIENSIQSPLACRGACSDMPFRVLIADDNASARQMLQDILKTNGHDVCGEAETVWRR
jgi:PleD family two-component response regulator